jgi:hypothetical protein
MKGYSGAGPQFFSKFYATVPSSYDDISCSLPRHIFMQCYLFFGLFLHAKGFTFENQFYIQLHNLLLRACLS